MSSVAASRVHGVVGLIIALSTLVVMVTACSDDESGDSGTSTSNGTTSNGTTSNGTTSNGTTSNGTTTSGTSNGTTATTSNGTTAGPCTDGELRCAGNTIEVCEEGVFVLERACEESRVCSSERCVPLETCTPGEVAGCWDTTAQRVCNSDGTVFGASPCDDGLSCLDGACTDMICIPEAQYCLDLDTVHVCNPEGSDFVNEQACPEGSVCLNGTCLSGCELSKKQPSYVGCQYWSVDLDNYNDPVGDPASVPHAVVISNPSDQEAVINITTMAAIDLDPTSFTVPAGGVESYTFPRLDVDGTGITNHSFFLESSWPVVAYQFNPLNNENIFSNDASLLLPAESLGTEYIAMSWPSSPPLDVFGLPAQHGYVTIVATTQGTTELTVTVASDVSSGSNVPFMEKGSTQEFSLRQFQVLNLQAAPTEIFSGTANDLTGTIIRATQPIAVFGGHEEAVVGMESFDPEDNSGPCCAEHLEQQLFPTSTWGLRYLAVQSQSRGGDFGDVWRIIAAADNTVVETIPPQPDAASFVLNRGEWIELDTGTTGASFEVVADLPIMVGQYLKSQGATAQATGDPAFILAVPLGQYRDNYTVLTPEGYSTNWVTIVRRVGAEVTLDGQPVPDNQFTPFGTMSWEFTWVQVSEGAHTIQSAEPFTLSAYGFSGAVSYGYPGGMNLKVAGAGE